MDSVSTDVLEERFAGLQSWLDERFARINDRFDQLACDRGEDNIRVQAVEASLEDHESRLVRLERLAWLVVGLATFLSPVVVWSIIEIVKAVF
jgi:hypothetical protein